jgi:2-polyprenyl-3-methyl-5-hydroxy-6-metoxy-1,4-benzoquinol methylase
MTTIDSIVPDLPAAGTPAPAARFDPIHSSAQMAELISSVTHQPIDQVLQRLRKEFLDPGISVALDFESRGIERYVMSDAMTRFYSESDGFLFELAVWNRNANKRFMCGRILESIGNHFSRPVEVLSIGDGLGFDCLEFFRAGHRVTYFELPGKTEACARRIFESSGAKISVLTDPAELKPACCDVLVCLDTLEHVPDPVEMVRHIAGYLRPGGLLFVHAPFYMIHPRYPTHLKTNRKFAGSLRLFSQHGLRAIDGDLFWLPLILTKADVNGDYRTAAAKRRWVVRCGSLILSIGRWGLLPLWLIHSIRRWGNRWFDKTGKPV